MTDKKKTKQALKLEQNMDPTKKAVVVLTHCFNTRVVEYDAFIYTVYPIQLN